MSHTQRNVVGECVLEQRAEWTRVDERVVPSGDRPQRVERTRRKDVATAQSGKAWYASTVRAVSQT